MTTPTETATDELRCVFCCHGYDSHDPDASDARTRAMPCRECHDGTCRHPGPADTGTAKS